MGLIRPDVMAPGRFIKSCYGENGYAYANGTSTSAPIVAGTIALMLSKNPFLLPEEIDMILETTAIDLGEPGKDNFFGAGRINALAALNAVDLPTIHINGVSYKNEMGNAEMNVNDTITLSFDVVNSDVQSHENLFITVSTESTFIKFIDNQESISSLVPNQTVNLENGFRFIVKQGLMGKQNIRFSVLVSNEENEWIDHFYIISTGPNFYPEKITIQNDDINFNKKLDQGEHAEIVVKIRNIGNRTIENLLVSIEELNDYLIFFNNDTIIEELKANSDTSIIFDLYVKETIPKGTIGKIFVQLAGNSLYTKIEFNEGIGFIIEDWESGTYDFFNWEIYGDIPWGITNDLSIVFEGDYAFESGDISANQSSGFLLDYDVAEDGYLSFYRKTISEMDHDFLTFYIDDQILGQWSGINKWEEESFFVSKGIHSFRWEYTKNETVDFAQDKGYIDKITFPRPVIPLIQITEDTTNCYSTDYQLDVLIDDYNSILWTSDGDGFFNDSTIISPIYTPGQRDFKNGETNLYLKAFNSQWYSVNATSVFFDTSRVNIGVDTIICFSDQILLNADNTGSAYLWSTGEVSKSILVDSSGLARDEEKFISVAVTTANHCIIQDEIVIKFNDCRAQSGESLFDNLLIYPNPNNGTFKVSFYSNKDVVLQVSLISTEGKLVYKASWVVNIGKNLFEINNQGGASGPYQLVFEDDSNLTAKQILIH
jgi:uncharacterized protein YlzI (FlbEa/FlbD family)